MNIAPKEISEDEFKKLQGQYQAQFGITMNKQVLLLFETQKTAHLQELDLIQKLYQQQREESAALYQEQIKVLNQKINQDKQQHEKYTNAIEKAVVAIGKQKGAIITENPEVVVKNNRSKYGIMFGTICSLILLLSCLGAFMYDRYHERQEEYRKITNALIDYPQIYKFGILAQNATIETNPDGREGEYLILTIPKKGAWAEAGKHYIYDKKNERILVPLHFSKQAHAK
jgi:hypothetical protein